MKNVFTVRGLPYIPNNGKIMIKNKQQFVLLGMLKIWKLSIDHKFNFSLSASLSSPKSTNYIAISFTVLATRSAAWNLSRVSKVVSYCVRSSPLKSVYWSLLSLFLQCQTVQSVCLCSRQACHCSVISWHGPASCTSTSMGRTSYCYPQAETCWVLSFYGTTERCRQCMTTFW